MVKILVLLFGVAMFFGGFWRATENKKRPDVAPIAEDLPPEPEVMPITEDEVADVTPPVDESPIKARTNNKAVSRARTKSKRSNQGKKVA